MKKRRILYIVLIILALSPAIYSLGRYVVRKGISLLVEANHFYFNSDKLTADGAEYQINNWSGVDTFTIQIELNSRKNNLLKANSDVNYQIEIQCGDNVTCSSDKTSGIVPALTNTDNLTVSVTPTKPFEDNASTEITVIARSLSPYRKTLKGTFKIKVGKKGISYEIDDVVNRPYLSFVITNALASYKIEEAFGSYSVGDEINALEYQNLKYENKLKCASATVTLVNDPRVVVFDTTSSIVDDITNIEYTTIGGVSYVSEVTFKVEANSTTEIRYYKVDVTKNYTYPFGTNTPIIQFNVIS